MHNSEGIYPSVLVLCTIKPFFKVPESALKTGNYLFPL